MRTMRFEIGRLQALVTPWIERASAHRYKLREGDHIHGVFWHWELTLGPLHVRHWRREDEQHDAYLILRPAPTAHIEKKGFG